MAFHAEETTRVTMKMQIHVKMEGYVQYAAHEVRLSGCMAPAS